MANHPPARCTTCATKAVTTRLRFQFVLSPLADLEGWGSPKSQEKSLHWFGLTYGHYWIEVGDTTLLEYTPEILKYWGQEGMDTTSPYTRYTDYQVARLWEDLLDLYRASLEPVPDSLAVYLQNVETLEKWEGFVTLIQEQAAEDEEETLWEWASQGFSWWHQRVLSLHFRHSPVFYAWRIGETIYLYEKNDPTDNSIKGIPIYTAQDKRLFTLPVTEFIEAMTDFNNRLMDAMQERIEQVIAGGLRDGITCDILALQRAHEDRKTWWANCLEHPYTTDWEGVNDALHTLKQDTNED
jgi:hypothetical protein